MSDFIAFQQKTYGPIVSGIINIVILCPVHYLVAALCSVSGR